MDIFCERQRGDFCRMHSINNYVGGSKLNEEIFYKYCDEYDSIIDGLKSRNMDGFAEGRSIVSYIMDVLFNKFILLIPYNSYKNSRKHLDMDFYNKIYNKVNSFFEFNKNHIWINKKLDGKMYKIDSIGGVNEINTKNMGKNGYFLVIDEFLLYEHVQYFINLIKRNIDNEVNISKDSDFLDYIEVVFYNLYYCLKQIDTNLDNKSVEFMNNSKFVSNLSFLDNLKKNLHIYILNKRSNENIEKQEHVIKNLIKYQDI